LEGIVTGVSVTNGKPVTSFFQISKGIKVEYNPKAGNGTRLVSVTIGDKPLSNSTTYQVVTLDFIAGGGDNFFTPTTDFITLDTQDEVLTSYIQSQSPVKIELDKRIEAVDRQRPSTPGGGNGTTPSSAQPSSPASTGAAARFGASFVDLSVIGALAGFFVL
jgi:hypothetical protein